MDGTTDSILMPSADDLVWSIPLLLGVALVAADGRFLRVNPALTRMVGRSVDELLELRWQDLITGRDLRAGEVAVKRAFGGDGGFDQVFRARHADGRELVAGTLRGYRSWRLVPRGVPLEPGMLPLASMTRPQVTWPPELSASCTSIAFPPMNP